MGSKNLSRATIKSIMAVRDDYGRGGILASTPGWLSAVRSVTGGKLSVGRMIDRAVELVAVSMCDEAGLWPTRKGSGDEALIEAMEKAGSA